MFLEPPGRQAVYAFRPLLHSEGPPLARGVRAVGWQSRQLGSMTERSDGEQGRALRPWLLRIARNVSLDQFKRASAKTERGVEPRTLGGMSDSEPGPAERAIRSEAVGILCRIVLDLPGEQRAVFLLKHDQGMTYAEVAEALGCLLRTTKYRMQAALEEISREAARLGVEV